MKTKTNVMAGGILNHNQTGIAVRTNVKAGLSLNFTKITYN